MASRASKPASPPAPIRRRFTDAAAAVAAVRAVLTPELRSKDYRGEDHTASAGHCYIAAEAVYHLLGGAEAGYVPMVARDPSGGTHWWLRHRASGVVVDPTSDQYTALGLAPPYAAGHGAGFLTRQPSRRAAILLQRVTAG